jgi:CDGSH iron-sulfur domain-containing protein 3
MASPNIAQKEPYEVKVVKGETYYWCACGKSATQPFCSGAHAGSEFTPKEFTAKKTAAVWLCGCKHTKNPPFCDGTHKTL